MRNIAIFVNNLVKDIPEIKPLYDENIEEYGELQEHLFMSDLTRYIIRIHKIVLKESLLNEKSVLVNILKYLEDGMKSEDRDIRDLVGASFVENLEHQDNDLQDLKLYFGPALKKQLKYWELKTEVVP